MTHMPKVETTQVQPIHPATEIGQVTLKVADLPRSIAFYTDSIGLTVFQQDSTSANLQRISGGSRYNEENDNV